MHDWIVWAIMTPIYITCIAIGTVKWDRFKKEREADKSKGDYKR